MALIKCKECGTEVSSKAATCPKCGVKIKRSIGATLALIFFSFVAIGVLIPILSSIPVSSSPTQSAAPNLKQQIVEKIKFEWTWRKAGFDNILNADFKMTNGSAHDIKDIEISTVQYAKSGTELSKNVKTIYDVLKAGETKEFKEISMGFIHTQTENSNAGITNFVVIK